MQAFLTLAQGFVLKKYYYSKSIHWCLPCTKLRISFDPHDLGPMIWDQKYAFSDLETLIHFFINITLLPRKILLTIKPGILVSCNT